MSTPTLSTATTAPCTPAHRLTDPRPRTPMTLPAALADITEPSPRNDIAELTLSALAVLNPEKALPIDPIEPTLPTDAIDSVEPRLAMLRNESVLATDHLEDMPPAWRANAVCAAASLRQ